jgi:hypothetical protein
MSDFDSHFQVIWHRARNAAPLATLTPELIQLWATQRGLNVTCVEEREIGIFAKIPAVVLTVGNVKACFPKIQATGDPNWELRRQTAEAKALLWEKMEWFSPLWIPRNKVDRILSDAKSALKSAGHRDVQLSHLDSTYVGLPGGVYRANFAPKHAA